MSDFRVRTSQGIKGWIATPPAERFAKRWIEDADGCWIWQGSGNQGGYGQFFDGRSWVAHRWAYEHYVEPLPKGLQLDHLCRNRRCVNPDHLEPVTQHENILRGESPNIVAHNTGLCRRGHPFDGFHPRGFQTCSVCTAERYSRRNEARRELTKQRRASDALLAETEGGEG